MRDNLRRDLTAALKSRDRVATAALRSVLTAIEDAAAAPADGHSADSANGHPASSAVGAGSTEVERRDLTETELRAIVAAEITDRTAAAREYEQAGRDDAAQRLRAEADVLNRYASPAE